MMPARTARTKSRLTVLTMAGGIVMLAAWLLLPGASLQATEAYFGQFVTTYPLANNPKFGSAGSPTPCLVCHVRDVDPALGGYDIWNRYGRDYRNNGHIFDSILEDLDSDGDGFGNGREIAALTLPGDPVDRPRATAISTVSSTTVVMANQADPNAANNMAMITTTVNP